MEVPSGKLDQEHGNLAELLRIGSFCVKTQDTRYGRNLDIKPDTTIERVVRPIISRAEELRVHGCPKDSELYTLIKDVSTCRRGYIELALDQELVDGLERFWFGAAWQRGAICVLTPIAPAWLKSVLSGCLGPSVFASPYQRAKASPRSAMKYCLDSARDKMKYAFLFTASNGLENLEIHAPDNELIEAYQIATSVCRPR